MRKTRVMVIVGLVAGLLAACSGGQSSDDNKVDISTNETAAACEAEPKTGGDLVYSRQVETQSLDPIAIRNGNGDIFADELIYDGLVSYDPKGSAKIEGGVAQTWKVAPDGKTYTFKLRDGIKFSNGDPVTAQDVKFSLDRFGNPAVNQVMGVLAGGYETAKVIDPQTIEITLSQAVPAFLDNIAVFPAFVVPKKLVEEQGDDFFKNPVGTGPFRVKEFVSGSHITFERNPYYWEAQKPYLDTVRFNFATDSNSRLLALTSGEAQIADGIPFSQIKSVKSNPEILLQKASVPAWISLSMNEAVKPLADQKVRQAIQYAIDRDTINETILQGTGTIPNSMLPQFKYDAADDVVKPYTLDVANAKKLMSESGYPDGFKVTLTYPSGFDYYNQMTVLLQQNLKAIGIDVNLVAEDAATIASKFGESDYEMTFPYPQLSSDIAAPDEFAGFYTGDSGFYTGWKDPAVQKLVATFVSTTDEASREKQWPVIQQAFMDQSPAINVMDVPFLNAHATNVCGTDVNTLGADQLQNTWITAG